MTFIDVFLGRPPALDQAEEDLGKPVEAEANDLALHVERCAQRWAMSYRASRQNHAQLAQIRAIMLIVAVALLARAFPDIASLMKVIFGVG
ncbi:hypothetical protein [uncultured Devosia sp.]|uniref:hypothetical protein n=1 Tax=uncultured Devosia sp. TaxID=211434 RepID=UPI00261CAC6B|nr:hypothetical protein [uncultured Devosia sp.]